MSEGLKFSTPTEELEYLRSKVLEAEKKLGNVDAEAAREKVVRESIAEFKSEAGIGAPVANTVEVEQDAETLLKHHQEVRLEEMVAIAEKKGIAHALSIIEKIKDWRSEDDFHAFLINRILQGLPALGVKESGPIYQALHMRLFFIFFFLKNKKGRRDTDD